MKAPIYSLDYDVVVIGAGVVGLSVAAELGPRARVLVVETCAGIGYGTSSRNSEVVHAGIYYPVGSLKARLCVLGRRIIQDLAAKGEIDYAKVGKLIVAVEPVESKSLNELFENARRNGVEEMERLTAREIKVLEPNVQCIEGVLSHSTGILSAHSLMNYFSRKARQAGVDFLYNSPASSIKFMKPGYVVGVRDQGALTEVTCRCVVNCAGLYADQVAELIGIDTARQSLSQVWSKGYYYRANGLPLTSINRLVYPVPTRLITTLGVHATIDLGGGIKFGPTGEYLENKVEDYSLPATVSKQVVDDIARYFPMIRDYELEPIMAGIRAKLQKPGQAHRDFHIRECRDMGLPGFVNLCGIESPGLTAAPAIGKYVTGLLARFH
ncbi:NAD(P)/FAD-dependent oxidoreductase [bacterium]|nr:MAG: NAD(P)/FAD-dependent oxidoreductase [bacterium]